MRRTRLLKMIMFAEAGRRVSNPIPGISIQDFFKFKCPVWVPVRAQPYGHGGDNSLDPGLCACTRVSCAPLLSSFFSFFFQPPPGQSHAHFVEREQESIPGISISRILGMGLHTLYQDARKRAGTSHCQNMIQVKM